MIDTEVYLSGTLVLFNFDILNLETNYQNFFYMNGNLVDVVIDDDKMKKFLLDNKNELENLALEFINKIN